MYLRGQYRHGSVKPPYGMGRADQRVAVLIRRAGYALGGVGGNGGRRGATCQQDTGHEGPDFSARQGKQAPLKGVYSCGTRPQSGAWLDAVWREKTRLHHNPRHTAPMAAHTTSACRSMAATNGQRYSLTMG